MTLNSLDTSRYIHTVNLTPLLNGITDSEELFRITVNCTALAGISRLRDRHSRAAEINDEITAHCYEILVDAGEALDNCERNREVAGKKLRRIATKYAQLMAMTVEMFRLSEEHPVLIGLFINRTGVAQASVQ